jgi:hypothetical protein
VQFRSPVEFTGSLGEGEGDIRSGRDIVEYEHNFVTDGLYYPASSVYDYHRR